MSNRAKKFAGNPRRQARPLLERPLSPQMARFVEEYVASEDLNATQAAIKAGYLAKSAKVKASHLLADARIQTAVSAVFESRSKRTQITADKVLERLWDIATADPNELVELRRACCAKCYPDNADLTLDPNPECADCEGEGQSVVHFHDTRALSGPARRLYAGAKRTRDGIEIKMHDQLAALNSVARHLGMFTDKIEHSGPGGEALAVKVTHVIVDAASGN